MDEAVQDAVFAEIVRRLLRMRIELTRVDFDELASAMLLDLDVAEIEAECQTAWNVDPGSASKIDPLDGYGVTPLISPAERVGVAQPG